MLFSFKISTKKLTLRPLYNNSQLIMRKIYTVAFLILVFFDFASAQDKHFTQFYAAPLTLNPALTGAFNGSYRVGGTYRDQWRNALDDPYVTFATAIDVRFPVEFDPRYKDAFAVGLLFYTDKVSSIDFNTNQIALSGAFHKALDFENKQYLSAGFQAGLAQRNVNYENLTFGDQFNAVDAFEFATAENLPENNFSFADFNVGINYAITPKKGLSFFVGAAMHHVFQPQLTFYTVDDGGDSKLFSKYSAQLSAEIPLNWRLSLVPRVLFATQGPHTEINAGSNIRIKINDYNESAIHVGGWVRPVGNYDDSFGIDAAIVMFGLELNSVLIGLSYDLNLTDLTTTQQGQGAFEISITYLGNFDNDSILCPKF